MKIFFIVDNALETKKKINKEILPPHILYGGLEFEKEGKAEILNNNLKDVFKIVKKEVVITNRLKFVPLLKLKGAKIILINMNSNHDLKKKKDIKGKIIRLFNLFAYKQCNAIICLSQIQTSLLKRNNIKNIYVHPLGVDYGMIKKVKKSKEYFLSSGFDKGKDHNFIKNSLKEFPLKILNGNPPIPYKEYLKFVGKAKAIVLKLDVSKPDSSYLSGTTTCFEGLLMGKPLFINYVPWAKELFKDNYYFYEDGEHLKKILKKIPKFKERDYNNLKLKNFSKKINEIIKSIN